MKYFGRSPTGRSSAGLHFVSVFFALRWRNHLGQKTLLPFIPLRVAPSVRTNAASRGVQLAKEKLFLFCFKISCLCKNVEFPLNITGQLLLK